MNGNGFCGTPRQTQSSPALLHLTFGEFLETAGRSKAWFAGNFSTPECCFEQVRTTFRAAVANWILESCRLQNILLRGWSTLFLGRWVSKISFSVNLNFEKLRLKVLFIYHFDELLKIVPNLNLHTPNNLKLLMNNSLPSSKLHQSHNRQVVSVKPTRKAISQPNSRLISALRFQLPWPRRRLQLSAVWLITLPSNSVPPLWSWARH